MGRVIDKRLFGLINDYFTLYLPNYKSASEHTLRSYRKAVEELLEFIKEKHRITLFEVSFDRITRELLQEFMIYLRREKLQGFDLQPTACLHKSLSEILL